MVGFGGQFLAFLFLSFALAGNPHSKFCRVTAVAAAESFGLHYLEEVGPGIRRRQRGKGFEYVTARGRVITETETLDRINALGIPPAYRKVWISPDPKSHIQATGVDERGRLQYRYHPDWNEGRSQLKFEKLSAFGNALETIRETVEKDLRDKDLSERRLIAAVVRLLDRSYIRIGHAEYAEENGSFGLTTLLGKHVRVVGDRIHFKFTGKSGVDHSLTVEDAEVAEVIRLSRSGREEPLFAVTADQVNEYLQETSGISVSAKDFRTWGGTVTAARILRETGDPAAAVEAAADTLGNTPAVCRKSYVHPLVLDPKSALDRAFQKASRRKPGLLTLEEQAVLILLGE